LFGFWHPDVHLQLKRYRATRGIAGDFGFARVVKTDQKWIRTCSPMFPCSDACGARQT